MTYHQKLNTLQINLLCETQLNVPHKCIDFQAIVALINEVVPRKLDRIIALNGILTNRHALTVRAMDYEVSKSKWTKEYELLPATYITRPIQERRSRVHIEERQASTADARSDLGRTAQRRCRCAHHAVTIASRRCSVASMATRFRWGKFINSMVKPHGRL